MHKRTYFLFIAFILSILFIAGCGSTNDEEGAASNQSLEVAVTNDETNNDTNHESNDVTNDIAEKEQIDEDLDTNALENEEDMDRTLDTSFGDLITYIEETTEGAAQVLYENNQPQTHEMDGFTLTLDSYTLIELNDFHTNFSIPFDDETNGGVIIAQYTVNNETDQDVHYMPSLYMTYVGAEKDINNYRNILPEEAQLSVLLSPSNDYLVEAGETVSGYYTYPFGESRLKDVQEVGRADVKVPTPRTDMDDYSSTIGLEGGFIFSFDEESAAVLEEELSQGFYQDKTTADNMGTKTMLEREEGIAEGQQLGQSTITLEGYQFTEFEPNPDEAPRFESFSEGVVLLTVKFNIDNGEEADISKRSMSSTLHLNDGKQWTLNEGMLLNYGNNESIASGEQGELLQIYVLDKEQYDLIWKDKSFEIEIGPLRDLDATDISKGQRAAFQLK